MEEKKKYINQIFENIVKEISISKTMLNKAISSYGAVGKWLGDCDPDLDVRIMPQGSINLGTVIKPISDNDDYDIDLVCLLKNGSNLSPAEIKGTVGKRLQENKRYKEMLEKEGKRCWTLRYDEFHMDILPCVPKDDKYIDPGRTVLRITHKNENGLYEDRQSDPAGYKHWFEKQMWATYIEAKRSFALENKVEIDEVPTYLISTPLQKVIKLLKRHRDNMFAEDPKGLTPISIIITTLAAYAYNNENNIYDAMDGILSRMLSYIEKDKNGNYMIKNPVMTKENFADKWIDNPDKAKAFFEWIKRAKEEIVAKPMSIEGTVEQNELFKTCFGEKVIQRAYSRLGDEYRIARENKSLYTEGLEGGVLLEKNKEKNKEKKAILRHTFYGK